MKKFRYILIMILSVTVSVSCSNDNDDDNYYDSIGYSALVGSWGGAETKPGVRNIKKVTFNENLSGTLVSSETFEGEMLSELQNFTWSTDGNKLILIFEGGEIEILRYSVYGARLTAVGDNGTFVLFARHKTILI